MAQVSSTVKVQVTLGSCIQSGKFSHVIEVFKGSFVLLPLTKVAPDDLRRRRPADFAVEASVAPLDHLQHVQLSREERIRGWDDPQLAA